MLETWKTLALYTYCCYWKKKYSVENTKENNQISTINANGTVHKVSDLESRRLEKDLSKLPGNKGDFWKRRYIIAFYGFLVYFLISAHRINISVAIVAMVDYSYLENHAGQIHSNFSTGNSNRTLRDQPIAQYKWNPEIQGYILGSGFFGYLFSLLIGGMLAETFGPSIILFIGVFISSFSTMVTPFTASVSAYLLMSIQCVRGVAQGFMLPAMTVLSANWFPSSERGFLSGITFSGLTLGRLLAGYLSSLICDTPSIGGWPAVFYIFGGIGIFVSILHMIFVKSLPKTDPRISSAELKYILENLENEMTRKRPAVPWKKILSSMPTYALILGSFGQHWIAYYFIELHVIFLKTILRCPMTKIGTLISAPYVLTMVVTIATVFLSSKAQNFLGISKVRKFWNLIASVIWSVCFALMIFTNYGNTATVISSIIGTGSIGFMNNGVMIVPIEMTPIFAGSLSGLTAGISSLAGCLLPVVCGVLTNEQQTAEQWNKIYIINIVISMATAIFFCIFGSAEIQDYNSLVEDEFPKPKGEIKNELTIIELKNTS